MADDTFNAAASEQVDETSLEIRAQAQQVALYLQTLKDAGIPDSEAMGLTLEWLSQCFRAGEDE